MLSTRHLILLAAGLIWCGDAVPDVDKTTTRFYTERFYHTHNIKGDLIGIHNDWNKKAPSFYSSFGSSGNRMSINVNLSNGVISLYSARRVTGYSLKITRTDEDRKPYSRPIVTSIEMLRKENHTKFTPNGDGEEIANLFSLDYTKSNNESLLEINVEVELLLWDIMDGS